MRVLILGMDGYLGWPTAMALSKEGHEVCGVDNYLRRNICREQDVAPLFPTPNLHERVRLWEAVSGKKIGVYIGDLKEWTFISRVFQEFQPDAVIHYAEQPSAPYSMLNRETAMHTMNNNLTVTANVIFAVKEFCPEAHIIKLGTMGEYGTPNIDIEEGWLDVEYKGRKEKFLYPRQGSSLYHTTKIMDTDMLWFYVRMWGLRVTDLMQGPVYGLFTEESEQDERLLPFFNYDELFGTVINRFAVQAVVGYPLTVYGKGGQTRGYINIKDTMNCVSLSVENPAQKGELRIFNQITETFNVKELADKVKGVGSQLGLEVQIKSIPNPRIEAEEHYYNPKFTGLVDLGLKPNYLTDEVLENMLKAIIKHRKNINKSKIYRGFEWHKK
ncbi:MAG: NAD-dependent epimerase/dehydratase family protein [Firmicutes bacterium]|nr:NAD-dependent epimerase/dehydratase family protein [Bacillota bacterium]